MFSTYYIHVADLVKLYERLWFILLVLFFWGSTSVAAQTVGRVGELDATGTSYHVFARPGQTTVQVVVLGDLGAPGIYEVGVGTDLGELFALAGGTPPSRTSQDTHRKVRREVVVALLREEGERRVAVYEASLEVMLRMTKYPVLQDGDIFVVTANETVRARFTWRDSLTITTALFSVAYFVERIISYF